MDEDLFSFEFELDDEEDQQDASQPQQAASADPQETAQQPAEPAVQPPPAETSQEPTTVPPGSAVSPAEEAPGPSDDSERTTSNGELEFDLSGRLAEEDVSEVEGDEADAAASAAGPGAQLENRLRELPGGPPASISELRAALPKMGVRNLLDVRLLEHLAEAEGLSLAAIETLIADANDTGQEVVSAVRARYPEADDVVLKINADLHHMETVRLNDVEIEGGLASLLTPEQAAEWRVLPYSRDDLGQLLVAIANPGDVRAREAVQKALPREQVIFRLTTPGDLATWIERIYDPSASGALSSLLTDSEGEEAEGESFVVRQAALDSRIIKIVDEVIERAAESSASDIHFEPTDKQTKIRFRIDGMLREVSRLRREDTAKVTARVKTMARMRIDEHRVPQDGRMTARVGLNRRPLDLRVVTSPAIYGEEIVMRLLDPSQAMLSLEELGMSEENLNRYLRAIAKPHGVGLVTGPTGSGKSTTLYSSLARVTSPERKLISIEDPVEYRLDGITQIDVSQARSAKGDNVLNFANALRAVLRMDPDIVMVGEIRDRETAQIAIDAALTGHFLYATLHTNTAIGSITRLSRIGVEPFLIAEAMEVIVAQRLIRRLCSCKREVTLTEAELAKHNLEAPEWLLENYLGREIFAPNESGCEVCQGIGHKGRTGIHEVVAIIDEIRDAIITGKSADEIEGIARANGMASLAEDAFRKVIAGETSLDEVTRVIGSS